MDYTNIYNDLKVRVTFETDKNVCLIVIDNPYNVENFYTGKNFTISKYNFENDYELIKESM